MTGPAKQVGDGDREEKSREEDGQGVGGPHQQRFDLAALAPGHESDEQASPNLPRRAQDAQIPTPALTPFPCLVSISP